jgi:hypothetical protein
VYTLSVRLTESFLRGEVLGEPPASEVQLASTTSGHGIAGVSVRFKRILPHRMAWSVSARALPKQSDVAAAPVCRQQQRNIPAETTWSGRRTERKESESESESKRERERRERETNPPGPTLRAI